MTVYTDFGYGVVEASKFKEEVDKASEAHKGVKQLILEYFNDQHAVLKAKAIEEEEQAKKAKAEAEAAAEEAVFNPPEEDKK